MGLRIVDRRTIVDEADSQTGWTGTAGVATSDFAEATGCVYQAYNPGSGTMYFTTASPVDLSDTLVYVYSFNNALQVAWDTAEPPNALAIGDGTNLIAFHQAGTDKDVFKHSEGPVAWQCLLLDGARADAQNAAGLTYDAAGSYASLDLTSIEDFGAHHDTLSKALAGGYNAAVDIIRYGNDGIYVVDGTATNWGTFSELASADRSTANQAAHGIFREYTTIAFGCQGPLTFGRAQVSSDTYFRDSGVVVVYEDRYVADDKYYMNFEGNGSATNSFVLINSTITTAAQSVSVSAGNNIDVLDFDTVSFVDLKGDFRFPIDSASQTHSADLCTFTGCGSVFGGSMPFRDCVFSNLSPSAVSAAAYIWDPVYADIADCNFNNNAFNTPGSSAAGVMITSAGSYDFDNLQFSGNEYDVYYTGSTGTTATINALNDSNVSTYYAPNGGAVNIQNQKTLTLTDIVSGSEVRILAAGTNTELDGVESVGAGGTFQYNYNYVVGTYIDIVIHNIDYVYLRIENYLLLSTNTSVPIQQQEDRWYSNP